LDDDDTTTTREPAGSAARTRERLDSVVEEGLPAHYDLRGRIAAGAMGEVHVCWDARLGREVALKAMLPAHAEDPALRARFEHEARVQGQLDHPAVVPVHEMATTATGAAFFTMKRVRGKSLREVLDALVRKDAATADVAAAYPRRRLLAAFATVCNAVAFAHARGVIHRDIKPGNVMIGDYGEVHLLDWGVARVGGEEAVAAAAEPAAGRAEHAGRAGRAETESPSGVRGSARLVAAASADLTEPGDVVGTMGYMAPEQMRGDPLDGRADVYSLGAVLFEVLTLERLHSRKPTVAATETVAGMRARADERLTAAGAPPELASLCLAAIALEPADRPDATALRDAIEGYLDGQRDRDARVRQADEHAALARAAGADALAPDAAPETRERALEEASRALALDPGNDKARDVLRALVAHGSGGAPEADAAIRAAGVATRRVLARSGLAMFSAWFVGLGVLALFGVRTWTPLVLATIAVVALTFFVRMHIRQQNAVSTWGTLLSACLAVAFSSATLGPFVVAPSILGTIALAFAISARPVRWAKQHEPTMPTLRGKATLVVVATFLAMCGAELLGLVPPSLEVRDGALVLLPRAVELPPAVVPFLIASHLALIAAPALLALRTRDHLFEFERRAVASAAHLRSLVPRDARDATRPTSSLGDDEGEA